jgi:hypothetical protein
MSTQKAVIVTQPKDAGLVTDRPIPTLRDPREDCQCGFESY